jgi:hypothetical protein
MGSGPVEAMAGPTIGPLLELGLVLPLDAAKKRDRGQGHAPRRAAHEPAKGFVPGNNIWYTKAATEHLVWQRVMEMLSPGYLNTIRSKTAKEYGQDWWWQPGRPAPDRLPDLGRAVERR